MKTKLIFAICIFLLISGCAAPAEQIVAIAAENTPVPAVTPVPSAIPTTEITAVPDAQITEEPMQTPKYTPQPTAAPTPSPTIQPDPELAQEPTPAPTAKPADQESSSDFGSSVLSLVNSYRNSAGLSSLKYSSSMQKAADTRAKECVSSFSHTRPDGSKAYTALTESGVSFTAFGENIFAASGISSVSAEYVVEQWMASQGHRENILRDSFTHMCIGVASQGEEIYVVQLFGAGIS